MSAEAAAVATERSAALEKGAERLRSELASRGAEVVVVGSTLGGALRSAERDAALLASELERLRGRNRSAALNALAVHARQRLERRHSDSASLLQSQTHGQVIEIWSHPAHSPPRQGKTPAFQTASSLKRAARLP